MTEDQRRTFFDASRDQWVGRMQQRMDEFFTLPPAQQRQRLDEILDRIVQARNSRQANAGAGDRGGRDARSDRGGGRSRTEADREARAKRRLDRSTPKQRAQFTELRRRLDERAKQRGIELGDRGWYGYRGA
jgi:hypothetical protein